MRNIDSIREFHEERSLLLDCTSEGRAENKSPDREEETRRAVVSIPARHRVRPVAPPNRGGPLI